MGSTGSDIFGGVTATVVILLAIAAIAVMIYGRYLKQRRIAGEKALIERREAAHIDAVVIEPDAPLAEDTPVPADVIADAVAPAPKAEVPPKAAPAPKAKVAPKAKAAAKPAVVKAAPAPAAKVTKAKAPAKVAAPAAPAPEAKVAPKTRTASKPAAVKAVAAPKAKAPAKAAAPAPAAPEAKAVPKTKAAPKAKARAESAAAPKAEPAPKVEAVAAPSPNTADGDITQLKGLGPKLATTLAELGYTRLNQIASLTPAQASELDARLGAFQGRMARDRWIEQATLLVAGNREGYEAAFGKLG